MVPGMVIMVNVVCVEIFFDAAFAGSAEVTTRTTAMSVNPICFTISSKCLYYL
jgi:hypothetical protein